MTWEPKNGLHDEDVDVSDEELDGDNSFTKDEKPNALGEQSVKPVEAEQGEGAVIWPSSLPGPSLSCLMV